MFSDPIATMYGPTFLVFYTVVIVIALIVAYTMSQGADTSNLGAPLQIPLQPDPYEIAYLRGGINETARLVVIGLLNKGYLTETDSSMGGVRRLQPADIAPPTPPDNAAEQAVYAALRDPLPIPVGLAIKKAELSLVSIKDKYEEHLQRGGLLLRKSVISRQQMIKIVGSLVIAVIGGYKLIAALDSGHTNVGFLIILGIGGILVLNAACPIGRQSKRGQAYLGQMQTAYSSLGRSLTTNNTDNNYEMLLMAGVFGASALAGTAYESYDYLLAPPPRLANGGGCNSCGSSCGGSSCNAGTTSSCNSGSNCNSTSTASSCNSASTSSCGGASGGGGSSCGGGGSSCGGGGSSCGGGGGGCGGCGGGGS